jgi:hypothetical protein
MNERGRRVGPVRWAAPGRRSDEDTAIAGRLVVLARSTWPTRPGTELPAVPGFIVSSFSPLAAHLAELCLRQYFGSPSADPGRGRETGVVIASTTGDIANAAEVARVVDAGGPVPPLLFYQSNPNAVAGHIAARWGLEGPVVCTIPARRGLADAMDSAALLIEGEEAAAALVILANQGRPGDGGEMPANDSGTAMLIGPAWWSLQPFGPRRQAHGTLGRNHIHGEG